MASERFEISLHGGSPWGFRLQGGKEFRAPLLIAKVTPGSKVAKEGVLVGDLLISINNEPCDEMTHSNALNCVKKSGNQLTLMLERRPYSGSESNSYSSRSLPRGSKLTNGDVSSNYEFKSVEGYATLPRSKRNKNSERSSYDDDIDAEDRNTSERPQSFENISSGFSSKYSEDGDDLTARAYGVMSPSSDDWSPDLISDAVRTPQPIRLVSSNEPSARYSNTAPRVKSPTTIHGFTDKPLPVGRGARRSTDEENQDLADYELLNSGSSNVDDMADEEASAAEKPYRRYSYHGSVLRDSEPKTDGPERPRIQAGSGWYKELFKEMHTGAGSSTGLSSLLAGDVSPPAKNDARGLFKSYRERSRSSQESGVRASKTQDIQAEPLTSSHQSGYSQSAASTDQSYRHSTSSIPSATATVKMREKPTTRSNVPSWYKELQKGKEVTEKEIYEDHKQARNVQTPGTARTPGNIGPEYPVVRSFSLGPRSSSNPVVHREPPKKMHTQDLQQGNESAKPAMRYSAASVTTRQPLEKEAEKPSATNLYEDHMRNRQFSPRPERRRDSYEPVDFIKQFEEEEERIREEERRAKEDLERRIREENRAKEEAERKRQEAERKRQEAERKRQEAELKKKEEMEARKNPKPARALYNFAPQTQKEIGFRKGDIVFFFRSIDSNWSEGEAHGQIGLFPTSYVEMLEENVLKIEGEGRVKYNFKAESARELDLQKGDIVGIIRQIDQNWYEGVKDERIGIFPVSYIEVLSEPVESPKPEPPQEIQEEISKYNGLSETESAVDDFPPTMPYEAPPEQDINNLEGEKFTVVFNYSPQNEDELGLHEGDTVKVVEKCDDGWFVGISERTGEIGTFPGNYVKQFTLI